MSAVSYKLKYLVVLVLLLSTNFAIADEQSHYDRIHFSAQASAAVENDTMIAILAAERQGSDVANLAEEVNKVVNAAIARVKRVKAVEVQTLDYQTVPVYEKRQRAGWRVSQSLQLKSRDRHALSKLIAELQNTLMLQGMRYQVSAGQRNKVEESLIGKAIAEFQRRAHIISHQLGRQRYRLVNMQINTRGPVVRPISMQGLQVMDSVRAAPTAIEAGKQTVTVTASGLIELERN